MKGLWTNIEYSIPRQCFRCNKKGIFLIGKLAACFEHKAEAQGTTLQVSEMSDVRAAIEADNKFARHRTPGDIDS